MSTMSRKPANRSWFRQLTGPAIVVLFMALIGLTCVGEVYVIQLIDPPPIDKFPMFKMTFSIGEPARNVEVTVLIDTGGGGSAVSSRGTVQSPSARARLGIPPNAGRPGRFGGIGRAGGRVGAPFPAGGRLTTPPTTPPGQASSNPPMPGSCDVLPLPKGVDIILGSPWLNQFEMHAIIIGPGGRFLVLVDKDQDFNRDGKIDASDWVAGMNWGTSRGTAAAYPAPPPLPAPRPNRTPPPTTPGSGQPRGTRGSRGASASPTKNCMNAGGLILPYGLGLVHPDGSTEWTLCTLDSTSFLPKAGITNTVIWEETLQMCGIDTENLEWELFLDEFGVPFEAKVADVEFVFFPDTDPILAHVAVVSSRPEGESSNLFGTDVLDQLDYYAEYWLEDGTVFFDLWRESWDEAPLPLPYEHILANIYDSLLRATPDGDLIPGLAETWEVSEDGLELLLHLRQGVLFHDGQRLSSTIVAENLRHPVTLLPNHTRIEIAGSRLVTAVDAIAPYTVKLTLGYPDPEKALRLLAGVDGMISAYTGEESLYADWFIGTGPFLLNEMAPQAMVRLQAFEEYWDGAPRLGEVIFRVLPEPAVMLAAFRAGEISAFTAFTPAVHEEAMMRGLEIVHGIPTNFVVTSGSHVAPSADGILRFHDCEQDEAVIVGVPWL